MGIVESFIMSIIMGVVMGCLSVMHFPSMSMLAVVLAALVIFLFSYHFFRSIF